MNKPGLKLREVPEFSPSELELLRDYLSVTTVPEFLDIAQRFQPNLIEVLHTNAGRVKDLVRAASDANDESVPSADTQPPHKFRTGHDFPF